MQRYKLPVPLGHDAFTDRFNDNSPHYVGFTTISDTDPYVVIAAENSPRPRDTLGRRATRDAEEIIRQRKPSSEDRMSYAPGIALLANAEGTTNPGSRRATLEQRLH